MTVLYYTYYPSPIGRLLILSDGESITHIDFEKEQYEPNPKWHKKMNCLFFKKYTWLLNDILVEKSSVFQISP